MTFVKPPAELYLDDALADLHYRADSRTYTEHNYLGDGLAQRLKTAHFRVALTLAQQHFGKANVIDFGCADGFLLPSLSRHFPWVAGVDVRPDFMRVSEFIVGELQLQNVQLVCNAGMSFEELKRHLDDRTFDIAFVLEVLEHVGERDRPWKSRAAFLQDVASLLAPDGLLVVTVPKMVGLPFLVQRIGLQLIGAQWEDIGLWNMLRAGILKDTDYLEPRWNGGHVGFNHLKLESALAQRFRILERTGTFFTAAYLLQKETKGD